MLFNPELSDLVSKNTLLGIILAIILIVLIIYLARKK